MKLSDVMGAADLAIYAEIGLVLFLLAFLAVAIRVLLPGRARSYEEAGMIPFADEAAQPLSASKVPEASR